ncbi:MAG: aldehyde dehydrogenase family protein, partial [Ardenticatenaceae bacterium]
MTIKIHEAAELHEETLSFLQRERHKLLIGGEWVEAQSGETFEVYDPATGEVVGYAAAAGEPDVDAAVAAAREAFAPGSPWRSMTPQQRGELLWKVADLVEMHARELAELDTIDNGKPYRNSYYGDLPQVIAHFRYYAGWTTKIE